MLHAAVKKVMHLAVTLPNCNGNSGDSPFKEGVPRDIFGVPGYACIVQACLEIPSEVGLDIIPVE